MKNKARLLFALALALGVAANLLGASKVSGDLQNVAGNTNVIVQFTSAPTSTMISSVTKNGGTLTKALGKTRFALFNLTPGSISALPNNTNVRYASLNRV